MSATTRVLLGLVLGAIAGLALESADPTLAAAAADIARPVGRLWLNALQMTVVPLVVALVVIGVNTASDAAASGRIARTALLAFVLLLAGGAAFAAAAAPFLLSLLPRDAALVEALRAAMSTAAPPAGPPSLADWFSGIVPANAIAAAAQGAMLPLVVSALL